MKITINDVPISFELEHEQSLGEVIDGIQHWLAGTGHHIQSIAVNGTTQDLTSAHWHALELSTVETIAITANSVSQDAIEGLETLVSYLSLLQRVMQEGTDEQVETVMQELPYVEEGIRRFVPDMADLLSEYVNAVDLSDPSARAKIAIRTGEIGTILESRQQELLDPERAIHAASALMRDLIPRFLLVSQQVQSGSEREAMNTVAHFSEVASRIMRLLPRYLAIHPEVEEVQIDGAPFAEAVAGINQMLGELEEAFQRGDWVLVGDLMEYEMAPRFETIVDHIA